MLYKVTNRYKYQKVTVLHTTNYVVLIMGLVLALLFVNQTYFAIFMYNLLNFLKLTIAL